MEHLLAVVILLLSVGHQTPAPSQRGSEGRGPLKSSVGSDCATGSEATATPAALVGLHQATVAQR